VVVETLDGDSAATADVVVVMRQFFPAPLIAAGAAPTRPHHPARRAHTGWIRLSAMTPLPDGSNGATPQRHPRKAIGGRHCAATERVGKKLSMSSKVEPPHPSPVW